MTVLLLEGPLSQARKNLRTTLYVPILVGSAIVIGFFGVFGTWASVTPLAGAAVAMGAVSPNTNRKTIQHLEGGIVKEIHVREGSIVEAGQPLVTLDETKARTTLEQQLVQLHSLRALKARLLAERWNLLHEDQPRDIRFPDDLLKQAEENEKIAELLEGEREQFESRQAGLKSSIAVLEQSIRQSEAEMVALREQIQAIKKHEELLQTEIDVVQELRKKGFDTLSRLLDLQRKLADQMMQEAATRVKLTTAEQTIAASKAKIEDTKAARLQEVTDQLAKARSDQQGVEEQIAQSRDVLRRTIIRSPVDGSVMNIQVHTLGGVIGPGGAVMDVVPRNDQLVIDVKVKPEDIDVVHEGQRALITLLAYPSRHFPYIEGRVTTVSADALVDESTSESYYLTKIEVQPEELKKLGPDVALVPGMPVEAFIETEPRTIADYLLDPIIRSMQRSFRES